MHAEDVTKSPDDLPLGGTDPDTVKHGWHDVIRPGGHGTEYAKKMPAIARETTFARSAVGK